MDDDNDKKLMVIGKKIGLRGLREKDIKRKRERERDLSRNTVKCKKIKYKRNDRYEIQIILAKIKRTCFLLISP
jgi:hypothetical protein